MIVVIVVVVIVDHAAVDSNSIDVLYYSCSVGAKLFLSVLIQLRMIELALTSLALTSLQRSPSSLCDRASRCIAYVTEPRAHEPRAHEGLHCPHREGRSRSPGNRLPDTLNAWKPLPLASNEGVSKGCYLPSSARDRHQRHDCS